MYTYLQLHIDVERVSSTRILVMFAHVAVEAEGPCLG